MPYWRLLYHLVWTTARRQPVLRGETAKIVERSIRASCLELELALHALAIMPDHVHVAVSIPPKHSIAKAVGRLKGSASHLLNHASNGADPVRFSWQSEYGALSLGSKALPAVIAYIENQEQHHADRTLWLDLERTDARD